MARISTRIKHAWNAFANQDTDKRMHSYSGGSGYSHRPDRVRLHISNERSIISSIYTRIGIDIATNDIRHIRLDEENRYIGDIDSNLNNCFTVEANMDQAPQQFWLDVALTLFDRGVAVIVPTDTTFNPAVSTFDVKKMRVGHVEEWFPRHVRVSVYNEKKGERESITLEKKTVAIIENPLYAVMNEPNSTLQRIIRKLNLLDAVDEQSASGKLDIIIQLPYTIKTDVKRQQAEQRRQDMEFQLKGSQYGIAYADASEKITQLNRPAENNLLKQIEYLMVMLYGQLGLTPEVMNGTADEATMLNYNNRTIKPIMNAVVQAMRRSFLSKTAISQKQWIQYFRDPFLFVPMEKLAEIADKLGRNEIVSSNEFRQFLMMKPSKDPKADQLRNSNMPHPDDFAEGDAAADTQVFDSLDSKMDEIFKDLGIEEEEEEVA